MRGFLLAAGLGTRLRPLTDELPKPAVPVGFRPLAASAFDTFRRAGIGHVDVNAYHLPDALEAALEPEFAGLQSVRVHRETTLLGTGGGLARVLRGVDEPVLVMNGDIQFEPDVAALLAAHERSGALATLVVRRHPDVERIGAVRVDEAGRVHSIAGQPSLASDSMSALGAFVFTGVHILSPALVHRLPEEGCIVRRTYQPLLAEGESISAIIDDSPWADLGTVRAYLEANQAFAIAHGGVHPDAVIPKGVKTIRSVVHPGCELQEGIVIRDSVIWPHAKVSTDVDRAVVTSNGVVVQA